MKNKTIQILIAYHKPALVLDTDILTPIHVGRAVAAQSAIQYGSSVQTELDWFKNYMIGDDTGDNVSLLNRNFAELTAIYWVWKNYGQIGDPSYIGLMHYRRLFMFNKKPSVNPLGHPFLSSGATVTIPLLNATTMSQIGLESHRIEDVVARHDLILASQTNIQKNNIKKYQAYDRGNDGIHIADDIITCLNLVKAKYPDMRTSVDDFAQDTKQSFFNMFIMEKNLFFEYAEWLFDIIFDLHKQMEHTKRTIAQQRGPAFIAERLTDIFGRYATMRKDKSVAYLPTAFIQNIGPSKDLNQNSTKNNILPATPILNNATRDLHTKPLLNKLWVKVVRFLAPRYTDTLLLMLSGCFDAGYYFQTYPELLKKRRNPVYGYVRKGASEGRNPNRWFDTNAYLAAHPEILKSGINPLVHYLYSSNSSIAEGNTRTIEDSSSKTKNLEMFTRFTVNNRIFAGLDNIDDKQPTFLVCSSQFRLLRYIEPLLNLAESEGYQIVVLNSHREGFCSEQFKMTKYIKSYRIINLSPWHHIDKFPQKFTNDYIFFFYALLYNFNIQAVFVDELHHPPLCGFIFHKFPFIHELMPPIIAFKHALLRQRDDNGTFKLQAEILTNYCNLYFVWGDFQKTIYSYLPQDQVISAGWNALERLKDISTSLTPKVFLALPPRSHKGCLADEAQVIEELLTHTALEVYIKAHPNPKEVNYPVHTRLHVIGDFDDYIPILASCTFSLSFGSNIFVESLVLKKPHVILPATAGRDPIFDPLRHLFIYDPDAGVVEAGKLLEMVKSQNDQWSLVDEYLSSVVANRFSSSEFMLRRIQAEIKKHVVCGNRAQR